MFCKSNPIFIVKIHSISSKISHITANIYRFFITNILRLGLVIDNQFFKD